MQKFHLCELDPWTANSLAFSSSPAMPRVSLAAANSAPGSAILERAAAAAPASPAAAWQRAARAVFPLAAEA